MRATAVAHPRRRSGFTIIEAMIATVMLTVLTVTGVTTVCLLMTAEQRAAESVVVQRTIATLADELRRDAHSARAAKIDAETTLRLTTGEGVLVTYECTKGAVVRTEEANGETVRREEFRLPFGTSRFELTDGGRLIVWTHEREIPVTAGFAEPAATTEQPRRVYRVEAAIGWRNDGMAKPERRSLRESDRDAAH